MALYALDERPIFPPPEMAEPDGLLAIGGDLSTKRLLQAYRNGIFPWFQGDLPMWWSPDPRFVLFPSQLKISRSMKQILKRDFFQFTINRNFDSVIRQCRLSGRKGQKGTWITAAMEEAYIELHRIGCAFSAECWHEGLLAGGLYGVKLGKVFFGESMFSHQSNASKFAFIRYMQELDKEGVELIDCQVYTPHLESLGATFISRKEFLQKLKLLLPQTP